MIFGDTLVLLDDESEIETVARLGSGHFGLVVVAIMDGKPVAYWHNSGFWAEFTDTEAESPRVFRTVAGAKRRQGLKISTYEVAENLDRRLAGWVHPDWNPGREVDRYRAMLRQVSGHPRK